jgi:hypothetical protein
VAFVLVATISLVGNGYQDSGRPLSNGKEVNSSPVSKPSAAASFIRVKVKQSGVNPPLVTLRSKNAPYPDVAAALARELKATVTLSDILKKQYITQEFENLPLETALGVLAPQAYIDYEIVGSPSRAPKPVALYLQGWNERPPSVNAVVKTNTQSIILTGDTEETTEPASVEAQNDGVLQVKYEKNLLTVHSNKQPLIVLLYEIASKLGIPFDAKGSGRELTNLNFTNLNLKDAVPRLSPDVSLYVRWDSMTLGTIPLLLTLNLPDKGQNGPGGKGTDAQE